MPFLTTRSYGIVCSSLPGSTAALAAVAVSYSTSRRAGQAPVSRLADRARTAAIGTGPCRGVGARGPGPPTGRETVGRASASEAPLTASWSRAQYRAGGHGPSRGGNGWGSRTRGPTADSRRLGRQHYSTDIAGRGRVQPRATPNSGAAGVQSVSLPR